MEPTPKKPQPPSLSAKAVETLAQRDRDRRQEKRDRLLQIYQRHQSEKERLLQEVIAQGKIEPEVPTAAPHAAATPTSAPASIATPTVTPASPAVPTTDASTVLDLALAAAAPSKEGSSVNLPSSLSGTPEEMLAQILERITKIETRLSRCETMALRLDSAVRRLESLPR